MYLALFSVAILIVAYVFLGDLLKIGKVAGNTSLDQFKDKNFDIVKAHKKVVKYGIVISNDSDNNRILNNKLVRLGFDIGVQEFKKAQSVYAIISLAIGLLGLLVFIPMGLVFILGSVVAYHIPLFYVNYKINERDKIVNTELLELYNVIFYVYMRNPSASLKEYIQKYIDTSSNLEFYQEMKLFLNDCAYGEKYALHVFMERVRTPIAVRFANTLLTRFEGKDNISQMQSLKNWVDNVRQQNIDKAINEYNSVTDVIKNIALFGPFFIIMALYLWASFAPMGEMLAK